MLNLKPVDLPSENTGMKMEVQSASSSLENTTCNTLECSYNVTVAAQILIVKCSSNNCDHVNIS